ncbi:MAG: esterase-like activity of phytase family protein [Myxococcaceae bacterium]|nr:esterase-like activity of phytase family protein [Myxococcaceae bacterium]
MRRLVVSVLLAGCAARPVVPAPSRPERARLIAHAVLPARTFLDGPASGARLEPRFGGPFSGQPVQGFSSLQVLGGDFVSISDNGYGVPENSGDFVLRGWTLRPDFGAGRLTATPRFALSDPLRHLPWPIRNAFTTDRVLTGADLDPESLVRAPDGTFWLGDEHGPFLVHVDAAGRVLEAPFEVPIDGGVLAGPDSPFLRANLMLRSLEALRAHAVAAGASPPVASMDHRWLTSAEQVRALHVAGFRVIPWTVNAPARLEELLRWDVDGVITDRPDLAASFALAGRELQGHRGARGLAPENTPAAFALGLDAGANVLELDLTGTADDEAVVWHDAALAPPKCEGVPDGGLLIPSTRLAVLSRLACAGTLAEFPLQRRDAGSHRLMTLTDALRLPGRLNLETKVHGTGQPHDDAVWLTRLLIRRVLEADAGARVTLQSFDWRSLELAHREAPWLQTVALFGDRSSRAADDARAGLPWPERAPAVNVSRSAGFENLALDGDGQHLVAMLEKPLPGHDACLAWRFDLTTKRFGLAFRFPLDARATAVGDLALVDERTGYALERDDTERRADGFKRLVRFTRFGRAGRGGHQAHRGGPARPRAARRRRLLVPVLDHRGCGAARRRPRRHHQRQQLPLRARAVGDGARRDGAAARRATLSGRRRAPVCCAGEEAVDRHAAALVWKLGLAESEVALVRRNGEERWRLPGGPLLDGEPWSAAAHRHAKAELDRALRVGDFVEASIDGERSRLYFDLILVDAAPAQYETASGQVCFVTAERALSLLDDGRDQQTLRVHRAPAPLRSASPTPAQQLRLFLSGLNVSFRQLQRALALQWAEQRALEANGITAASRQARDELAAAEALACDEPESGWAMLKRARRTQLAAMTPERRRAQWLIIREEAKRKLERSWRGTAARALMGGDDEPSPDAMAAVAELLDGYHDSYFDRARLIQTRLALMTLLLFLVLTVLESVWWWKGSTDQLLFGVPLMRVAPLLGVVGAICSSLVSSLGANSTRRPQVIVDSMLVFGRVALGAGSGLGMVLLLGTTVTSVEVLAALAFVAGFSERALPAQVERLFGELDNGQKETK